jgi:hypothetical protein
MQNEDGGWGKQVLGPSTMFGECFNYASLMLLGEKPNGDNDALAKGRSWILSHGSATAIPQWGKIWLSVSVKLKNIRNIFDLTLYSPLLDENYIKKGVSEDDRGSFDG